MKNLPLISLCALISATAFGNANSGAPEPAPQALHAPTASGSLRIYRFGYPVTIPAVVQRGFTNVIAITCDANIDFSRPTPGVTCLVVGLRKGITMSDLLITVSTDQANHPLVISDTFPTDTHFDAGPLANMAHYASANQPVQIAIDLNSSVLHYSIDGSTWIDWMWSSGTPLVLAP